MSSDGPGREDDGPQEDPDNDDQSGDGDSRDPLERIDFEKVFGINQEAIRKGFEGLQQISEQLSEVFTGEAMGALRTWHLQHVRGMEQIHDAFLPIIKAQQELQQHRVRIAPAVQAIAHQASGAQLLAEVVSEALIALQQEVGENFPPQHVLAAAFTQSYPGAKQAQTLADDDVERGVIFAVAWASSAWEWFARKQGPTIAKALFVQFVIGIIVEVLVTLYFPNQLIDQADQQAHLPAPRRLVVEEETDLRAGLEDEADMKLRLQTGQDVEFIEEREGWVRVRFFDEASETYNIGWVRKGYLLPLDTSD